MKKEYKIIIAVLIVVILGGGAFFFYKHSTNDKYVKKGIELMDSGDYEKALATFEVALDEKSNNKDALKLKGMIEKYLEGEKLLKEGKSEEAKENINEIDEDYVNYSNFKKDVDNIKGEIEDALKGSREVQAKLDNVRDLINKKDFSAANKVLNNINKDKLNGNERQQFEDLKGRVDSEISREKEKKSNNTSKDSGKKESLDKAKIRVFLDDVEKNTPEFDGYMNSAQKIYSNWDDALNIMWGYLKDNLPKGEFDTLKKEQIKWIKAKEDASEKAAEESNADKGSEVYRITYMLKGAEMTAERCHELENYF